MAIGYTAESTNAIMDGWRDKDLQYIPWQFQRWETMALLGKKYNFNFWQGVPQHAQN